jgi:hypothetical protein
MTVYPDGDALSGRELHVLEEIERDLEVSDPWLLACPVEAEPARLYAVAAYLVAAEAAVALATFTVSMAGVLAGLATIGTSAWVTSAHAARGLRVGSNYSIA